MSKALSILLCCGALLGQQDARAPAGEGSPSVLPALLRQMDDGAKVGPQLRLLGPVAQAAALGLWALAPQQERAADFARVFDDVDAAVEPDGDGWARIGELLDERDALVAALGAERIVPVRWVGAGRLEPARRDALLEQLSSGPGASRAAALELLLGGAEADALLANERLLVLETEPDTRQQARDLQLLLHARFALRTRLDGDAPAARTLLRQVLCGRLADPEALPPLAELGGGQLYLLALGCLGEPSRSAPHALRPWQTLRLLQGRADDAELARALRLVETVRRDRVEREVLSWPQPLRRLWRAPDSWSSDVERALRTAPASFWSSWGAERVDLCAEDDGGAAVAQRVLTSMRRTMPPRALLPFLPDLAATEPLAWEVSRMLPNCEPEALAAELRAARYDTTRLRRWMDLLLMPTGDSRRLLEPLVPLLAASAQGWPAEVQGSYVLFGPAARVPAARWSAMLACADVVVRRRAAQAAWRHHAVDGPSMSTVAAALRDPDDEVVQHAASWFLPRPGAAVERDASICELLGACDAAPARGRARILGVLGMLQADGEPVEAVAQRALAANEPAVQVQAACLLLRLAPGDEARQRTLAAMLEVESLEARRDALFAAGNLGEVALPFVEVACRQLRCADEAVAAAAARLLSRIPSIAAVARVELETRRAEVGERSSLGQRLSGYLRVVDRR